MNALIHRSYLQTGAHIQIDIYDDRMVITNPGGMYDGSEVQNLDLRHVPSKLRNPIDSSNEVLKTVGEECVVMQRNKMANGGYDTKTNDTGLNPENNGQRTVDYKGFDDVWVQTGETISAVDYKVTKR